MWEWIIAAWIFNLIVNPDTCEVTKYRMYNGEPMHITDTYYQKDCDLILNSKVSQRETKG